MRQCNKCGSIRNDEIINISAQFFGEKGLSKKNTLIFNSNSETFERLFDNYIKRTFFYYPVKRLYKCKLR